MSATAAAAAALDHDDTKTTPMLADGDVTMAEVLSEAKTDGRKKKRKSAAPKRPALRRSALRRKLNGDRVPPFFDLHGPLKPPVDPRALDAKELQVYTAEHARFAAQQERWTQQYRFIQSKPLHEWMKVIHGLGLERATITLHEHAMLRAISEDVFAAAVRGDEVDDSFMAAVIADGDTTSVVPFQLREVRDRMTGEVDPTNPTDALFTLLRELFPRDVIEIIAFEYVGGRSVPPPDRLTLALSMSFTFGDTWSDAHPTWTEAKHPSDQLEPEACMPAAAACAFGFDPARRFSVDDMFAYIASTCIPKIVRFFRDPAPYDFEWDERDVSGPIVMKWAIERTLRDGWIWRGVLSEEEDASAGNPYPDASILICPGCWSMGAELVVYNDTPRPRYIWNLASSTGAHEFNSRSELWHAPWCNARSPFIDHRDDNVPVCGWQWPRPTRAEIRGNGPASGSCRDAVFLFDRVDGRQPVSKPVSPPAPAAAAAAAGGGGADAGAGAGAAAAPPQSS
jgi:hypothetical protein